MPRCATSSSTCTGSWIRHEARPASPEGNKNMLKKLGRSPTVQGLIGLTAVAYLRLVRATTRFVLDPPDFQERVRPNMPIIIAMWHGQHLLIHYACPPDMKVAALISKSGDGEINARVLERLGVHPIRGSGGSAAKSRKRGGAAA